MDSNDRNDEEPLPDPGFEDLEGEKETSTHRGKSRKTYTITKQREVWTPEEHEKFLEALRLYDRDWKRVEAYIGTKTVVQIRSHAQKHFLKLQKAGEEKDIPPPRGKRKASLYNDKEAEVFPEAEIPTLIQNPYLNDPTAFAHWMYSNGLISGNYNVSHSSSSENEYRNLKNFMTAAANTNSQASIMTAPDFDRIYTFLGSLFDPSVNDHLDKLATMSEIDRETIQYMMHNLAINLSDKRYESHYRSLVQHYRTVIKQKEFASSDVSDSSTSDRGRVSLSVEDDGQAAVPATPAGALSTALTTSSSSTSHAPSMHPGGTQTTTTRKASNPLLHAAGTSQPAGDRPPQTAPPLPDTPTSHPTGHL